jgi:ribose transport system substrate-binding protein
MKKRIVFSIFCVLLAVFFLWWGVNPIVSTSTEEAAVVVALLLDTDIGTTAQQIKQGAKLAAKERKVDLLTVTTDEEGGAAGSQAELIAELLGENVKAIVLVPAQGEDLSQALEAARQQKVPVLTLGETASDGTVACEIGNDNEEVGRLAGEALVQRLTAPGRVILVEGEADDAAAALRLAGAASVLDAHGDVSVLCRTTLSTQTPEELLAILDTCPDVNGILCLTGEGTETAAKTMGRLDRDICLVGMDCGQNRTTYLENRQVDAMVLGMPYAMGYLGVQYAAAALNGEDIPAWYHTESRVIDLSNMYLPENQKLAFPILQ